MKILALALLLTVPAVAAEPPPDAMTSAIRLPREESPMNVGLDIQYSPVRYENYTFRNGVRTSNPGHGAYVNIEWLPFEDTYGKFGFGLGLGMTVHTNVQVAPSSYATLYAVPAAATLSYRFDYIKGQFLVPFVNGGAGTTLVRQGSRTGGAEPGTQLYHGYEYGGGLELCLNGIDPQSARVLDSEIGINYTYLTAEYVRSQPLGAARTPDLSREEFRFGLRFEL